MVRSAQTHEALDRLYDWRRWARPDQLPPRGDWSTWLVLAGRGFGKTRLGVEWVRAKVERAALDRTPIRLALVARTAADVRDVIVEGESGILATADPRWRPIYEPSKRRLTWPDGSQATTYTADEPSQLRGPQHHAALADELAAWGDDPDALTQLLLGLRLGSHPQLTITTTPRPSTVVKRLVADPSVKVTRGRTLDNARNLPAAYLAEIQRLYSGTRIGRQELDGEILTDTPGALWTLELVERNRLPLAAAQGLTFSRVVVAVDPQAAEGEHSAETGIVAVGLVGDARTGYAVVLDDASVSGSPSSWARRALGVLAARRGDRIVAEVNNGGDMVIGTIRAEDPNAPCRAVHASRGKEARAEPVVALTEQGRVRFAGAFPELEKQLCGWVPGKGRSPDRLDALVWAVTDLMLTHAGTPAIQAPVVPIGPMTPFGRRLR